MSVAEKKIHGSVRKVVAYGREVYTVEYPYYLPSLANRVFHYQEAWNTLTWMGVKIWKYPTDLWLYQELVFELQPDLIVETGTAFGGSALYLAHLCDILGIGHVVTIDIADSPDDSNRPEHPRITYVKGSSTDLAVWERAELEKISQLPAALDRAVPERLVILDSDHSAPHVRKELEQYAPGAAYIIVEDTNLNGHPVRPKFGPGPYEAVEAFLSSDAGAAWERDSERERLLLSANPGGYLRRRTAGRTTSPVESPQEMSPE